MTTIFSRRTFWLLFALSSSLAGTFSYFYFPTVFPIITLELKLDRTQARDKAREIAQTHELGPTTYRQAASFETDQELKTFIEFEGEGNAALIEIMHKKLAMPYLWKVRHFNELETHELEIQFTPNGTPYGFIERLEEDALSTNISSDEAQRMAEENAQADWSIDFDEYHLIETSDEAKPNGRIDHTFVYERPERFYEGSFRVKLVVSGNQLTQVVPYLQIPEEFTNRYTRMRSDNNIIAMIAFLFAIVLYGIGGCLIGLIMLARRHWILARPAFIVGISVATLTAFNVINQLPLYWMQYNTALPIQTFLFKIVVMFFYIFFFTTFGLAVIIMSAEALDRKAFGNHLQFWQLWKKDTANSYTLLGQTLGAYLTVPFLLAYVVLFYFVTLNYCGWWTPSSELINPNVLATYFPWLSGIAHASFAGIMEECLFRAIPLSLAVLIGKQLGNQRRWLVIGFIVQALIFAAAHANYPSMPAYSRVVELFFVASLFGGIYLRFGLLPAIISHTMYDLLLFSLPLFASDASGSWINQLIVTILALIPLLVVFAHRIKQKRWIILTTQTYNAAWQTPLISTPIQPPIHPKRIIYPVSNRIFYGTLALAIIGGIMILYGLRLNSNAPRVTTTKVQALAQAQQTVANYRKPEKGEPLTFFEGRLEQSFDQTTSNEKRSSTANQHRFIWQEGGPSLYHQLLGTYLNPPHWAIRFVQLAGSIADRMREHQLRIGPDGKVIRHRYQMPESQPGNSLSLDGARLVAYKHLADQYQLKKEVLSEISVTPEKKPERTDWRFVFADTRYPLANGQARITITIAGNNIVDSSRSIHVPEQWKRAEEHRQQLANIFRLLCALCAFILFVIALVKTVHIELIVATSLLRWLILSMLLAILFIIDLFNGWPLLVFASNAFEPFLHQIVTRTGFSLLGSLLQAAIAAALIVALGKSITTSFAKGHRAAFTGIQTGFLLTGIVFALRKIFPVLQPVWPELTSLSYYFPVAHIIINGLSEYLMLCIFLMTLFLFANRLNKKREANIFVLVLFVLTGLSLMGISSLDSLPHWWIQGALVGLALWISYLVVFQFDITLVPIAVCVYLSIEALQQTIYRGFPQTITAYVLLIITFITTTIVWYRQLQKQ